MKIFEKKCPNCGANLQFKPGEHSAHCDSCRRDFIIEYNKDSDLSGKPDLSKLSIDDIDLAPAAKIFGTVFLIHNIIAVIIFIVVAVAMIGGIIFGINQFNNAQKRMEESRNQDSSQSQEEFWEDFEKHSEKMKEEYDKAVEKMKEGHDDPSNE